ncbi:hypothetical protein [Dactylosporangium sp. CA-139066]|uniref:hypothetical protein n=1 Tax=Dactylosporangium sp. CA-139066 TaxID=3239930 RepID=UPI003D8F115A
MTTPTSSTFDLLEAAQYGHPVSYMADNFTEHLLLDVADRGLVEVRHSGGGTVSMRWALRQAGSAQRSELLRIHLTAAGRDFLQGA